MTTENLVHALCEAAEENPCACLCEKCDQTSCMTPLLRDAAFKIELQTVKIKELEAKVPRWIPVTERLPEVHQNTRKSEAMLVYTRRKLFMVAIWNGIDWLAPMDFWDAWGDEIVCWMPLPEAAKEV